MKQKDLLVGKEYYITYSGQFCHRYTSSGSHEFKEGYYTFVGCVDVGGEGYSRNIFYNTILGYLMFDTRDLSYITDEKFIKLKKFVEDNSISEETIKRLLND